MSLAGIWVVPVAVLGAVIGSFLNVVAFRLPRGLSIRNPRWSFCPHCEHRIRPYDNIPIVAWLLRRGRCRHCAAPIAALYPLVECLTVLVFVTVWDALCLGGRMPRIGSDLGSDWPIILAYLFLFAGLLATATMDFESYTIDVRISVAAMVVGVVGNGVWWSLAGPPPASSVGPPSGLLPPSLCLAGTLMGAVWIMTTVVAARLRPGQPDPQTTDQADQGQPPVRADTTGAVNGHEASLAGPAEDGPSAPSAAQPEDETEWPTAYLGTDDRRGFRPWPILALFVVIVALVAWQALRPDWGVAGALGTIPAAGQRGIASIFLLMLVLILASMVSREADQQIIDEIEAERHDARSVAVREFGLLLPALLAGAALFAYLRHRGALDTLWTDVPGGGIPFLAGAAASIAAMVLAAALGWTVRILGTLTFGKEAFGSGDIFIMAAIGAVAGLWIVVFGFFLAAVLALIGVSATVFHKSSRAIPFGPWLALGAFVAIFVFRALLRTFAPFGSLLWQAIAD